MNRIGVKLVLVTAIILAAEVGVVTYVQGVTSARQAWQDFLRDGTSRVAAIAQAAEYGLLTRDPSQLRQVAEMFHRTDDAELLYIAFYDEAGEQIAVRSWYLEGLIINTHEPPSSEETVRRCDDPACPRFEHYTFQVPVAVSRQVMGEAASPAGVEGPAPAPSEYASVVACLSYEGVKAEMRANRARMLVVSGLVFAGAIVAVLLFGYALVSPVRGMVRAMERVAQGDFAARVDVGHRRDELAFLGESFNRMIGQLREQREQILSHSHDLEENVAARTRELAETNTRLQAANHQLEDLATTDELTGLWNRRRFMEMLERECRRATRTGTSLALAMLDVDRFKAVNDTYGHAFGDRVLVTMAEILRSETRATDIAARYGGEEFMVLMPDTTPEEAVSATERMRRRIAVAEVADSRRTLQFTVSIGVSALGAGGASSPENLIRLADEALYAAKHAGRNCTKTWNEISRDQQDQIMAQAEEVEGLQRRLASLSLQAKDVFVQSIQSLVHALEARDPYSRSHADNVTLYAVGIAETLHLDPEEVAIIRRAAQVHDIGKIGVPDAILRKPGRLTVEERRIMNQHVLIGVGILDQMRFLEREVPIVRHHHERWDGKGYPDGIGGKAISLGARILAVADTFDALTSDRVYRAGADMADALRVLVEEAGRQFDPDAVDAMIHWVCSTSRSLGPGAEVSTADMLRNQAGGGVATSQ